MDEVTTTADHAASRAGASRSVLLTVVAVAATLGTVALTLWRIRYAIDFTDESYYVAVPYFLALGTKPFVNEVNILQFPGFLTYPLVKAYVSVVGSSTGIMLAMRCAYVVFECLVAASAFVVLRRLVRWQHALLASAACVAFIPFNIPNLFYNTMGSGLVTAGFFIGILTVLEGRGRGCVLAAGVLHALAAIAYPSLAGVAPVFAAALWFLLPRERRVRLVLWYAAGLTAVYVPLLAVLVWSGLGNVAHAYEWTARLSVFGGGGSKLRLIVRRTLETLRASWPLPVAAGGALLTRRRWPSLSALLVLALPLAALPLVPERLLFTRAQNYLLCFGLTALPLYFLARPAGRARTLALGVAVPASAAGLLMAYTSSNGYRNLPIAGLGVVLVASVLLAEAATRALAEGKGGERAWHAVAVALSLAVVLAVNVAFQYRGFYREQPLRYLTSTVDFGPFSGLRTTPDRYAYLGTLDAALKRYTRPGDRILFYNDLPAGYLMTSLSPGTDTAWHFPVPSYPREDTTATVEFYRTTGETPDVVVRNEFRESYPPTDAIDRYVRDGYARVYQNPRFSVWRKRVR